MKWSVCVNLFLVIVSWKLDYRHILSINWLLHYYVVCVLQESVVPKTAEFRLFQHFSRNSIIIFNFVIWIRFGFIKCLNASSSTYISQCRTCTAIVITFRLWFLSGVSGHNPCLSFTYKHKICLNAFLTYTKKKYFL